MRYARSQPRSRNSAGNFGPDSVANIAVAVVTRRSGPRTSGVSTGRGRERERDDEQGDSGNPAPAAAPGGAGAVRPSACGDLGNGARDDPRATGGARRGGPAPLRDGEREGDRTAAAPVPVAPADSLHGAHATHGRGAARAGTAGRPARRVRPL